MILWRLFLYYLLIQAFVDPRYCCKHFPYFDWKEFVKHAPVCKEYNLKISGAQLVGAFICNRACES